MVIFYFDVKTLVASLSSLLLQTFLKCVFVLYEHEYFILCTVDDVFICAKMQPKFKSRAFST